MNRTRLRPTLLAAMLLLGGCAELPEKRHSAAELQTYRPADFRWAPRTERGERELQARELARQRERLALPPGAARDAALPALLAAQQLFSASFAGQADAVRALLLEALPRVASLPVEQQRALLAAAHAMAPREAAPLLRPQLAHLATPREFAIAAYTLLRADAGDREALGAELDRRLAREPDEPRLLALQQRLAPPAPPPPLAALLRAPLLPGLPVVFSIQRPDRRWRGLALVRGADGEFLREPDGRLFAVPQLALALSDLPGTITLGNTPQGLFSVVGAGTASNPWIGPTPYLHSMLPVEATPAAFFHGKRQETQWSEALYQVLLPPAWAAWPPFREAWLAGRAGRSEILMHGTTVNPAYYAGQPYAPGTPSAGCLVADETWRNGRLLHSDQLRLAQAFSRGGHDRGLLLVVELAGEGAVRPAEIDALLR